MKDYLLSRKFEKRYVKAVADDEVDDFLSKEYVDMYNNFDKNEKTLLFVFWYFERITT